MNSYNELFETTLDRLSKELGRPLVETDVNVMYVDINNDIITFFEKNVRLYYKMIPQPGGEWKIIQL